MASRSRLREWLEMSPTERRIRLHIASLGYRFESRKALYESYIANASFFKRRKLKKELAEIRKEYERKVARYEKQLEALVGL